MPWRQLFNRQTWANILIQMETRPLELITAAVSAATGGYILLAPVETAQPIFWHAIDSHGGAVVWAWWSLFNAIFQWTAVWYRYPHLRRWSSSSSLFFWSWFAYAIGSQDFRILPFWYSCIFGFAEFMITLRRAAISSRPTEGTPNGYEPVDPNEVRRVVQKLKEEERTEGG